MTVFYKYKSAKDYNSITLDAPYISVRDLKVKIFQSKQCGRGRDFDILVANAQTNEEYIDESMLIPKNSSVTIRRVPGFASMPIVTAPLPVSEEPLVSFEQKVVQNKQDDLENDGFGRDLYAVPEMIPSKSIDPIQSAQLSKMEEDEKIKALTGSSTLEWQRQSSDGCSGPSQGFGRGMEGGRVMRNHGFGQGILERRTPPEGYVCYRCKVPGHLIQHCPTNGDPNYDIKRFRTPTGIPQSQLITTPDGSYVLPGSVASVKPDEDAFEKEIGCLLSKRSTGYLPPELRCPLCREIMKDAVLTSKCCFRSFCDKCIRDFTVSKSACICGAKNVLADHLVPNVTVRDTINRMSDSDNSSGSGSGSVPQVHGNESRNSQLKTLSSAQSEVSKGAQLGKTDSKKIEAQGAHKVDNGDNEVIARNSTSEGALDLEVLKSRHTLKPVSVKERAMLQGNPTPVAGKEQLKPASCDSAKKKKAKKVKKVKMPDNGPEINWVAPQYFPDESYMMPMAPAMYNPYWTGSYAGAVPYMGFGCGPLPSPFTGGVFPQDQSFGPACSFPFGLPQRNVADPGMRSNADPSLMNTNEVEARNSDLKRKHEMNKSSLDRDRDRDDNKQVFNDGEDGSSMKLKSKSAPRPEHPYQRHQREKSSPNRNRKEPTELHLVPSKRKSEQDRYDHRDYYRSPSNGKDQNAASMSTRRISSREIDYERGDNDQHSKRRTSRYNSPPAATHSRWSAGERVRDQRRRSELEQSVY